MPPWFSPPSHYFRFKAPWLTWKYEYGLFFLEFPPETSRVPKPAYQENSQGCTLKVSRSMLVTIASLLVTSRTPFIVTCFNWQPLEILSNVLLKSSTTSLLTEMGRKSGQEDRWKGEISLLWLHMIWFCDFQSLKKKKKINWFKNNQGPKYFWFPFIVLLGTNQLCSELQVIGRVVVVVVVVFITIQETWWAFWVVHLGIFL